MLFYAFVIVWYYVYISFNTRLSTLLKIVSLIPFVLFSGFRGLSGPDTGAYYNRFNSINDTFHSSLNIFNEPGLPAIMKVAYWLSNGEYLLFSFFYAVLFIYLFKKIADESEKYKVFIYSVGLIFFVDGLTNTLRVSVAYFIFLWAVGHRKLIKGLLFGFVFHVSTAFMFFFIYIAERIEINPSLRNFLRLIVFAAVFFIILATSDSWLSIMPRVDEQLVAYAELQTRSSLSGLSDIYIIFCLLFIASIYNRSSIGFVLYDLVLILLLCFMLFAGTSLSLGFLRILKIIILVICVSPALVNPMRSIPRRVILLLSIPYTLNFLYLVFMGESYLPYGQEFYYE
ncbi:EpsG family protein [Vibrio splendidus]